MGGGGGQVKFYPYKEWVAEKVLTMLKGGGGTTRFEVVLTRELEVLANHTEGGGGECPPFI